jgi:hypothetical protein
LAKEIVAMDPRETARLVGRINAMMNQVDGVKFLNTRTKTNIKWDDLPLPRRADLMVAAIPAKESPIKSEEWKLLNQAIFNAHIYLNPKAPIYLGMENAQDFPFISDLFKKYGYPFSTHLKSVELGDPNAKLFILEARAKG